MCRRDFHAGIEILALEQGRVGAINEDFTFNIPSVLSNGNGSGERTLDACP